MQPAVEAEIEKLVKEGHIKKLEEVGDDRFVSSVVVTRKSDGSVKIAIGLVELTRRIVKQFSPNSQTRSQ